MRKKACRFMTAPYVGITQIRLWVEAFASSQPAPASSPVHDLCNLCPHYSMVQGPAQGFFLPWGGKNKIGGCEIPSALVS